MFPEGSAAHPPNSGFLAVDSGGSGLRVAVGAYGGPPPVEGKSGRPVRTGERGIDPAHLLELLLPLARTLAAEAGVEELTMAVIGAAGFATLGDALRTELPDALTAPWAYGPWPWPPTRSPRTSAPSDHVREPCSRPAPA